MTRFRTRRATVALVVIVCFLTVGCAEQMAQAPGKTALLCGAGGAAVGAAVGSAASRNWQGALIGAAVGALASGLTCFAFAQYKSQQVRGYTETQQATGYQPTQGDSIRITRYEITPAAVSPGSSVAFNATYTVMTPNPDADIAVTEVRSLYAYDAATNNWKELGRVPNQVTVKPGTRQADGKFDVRSGVAEGNYRIVFEVVKESLDDTKTLPLVVTTNQAILSSPDARVAQVSAPGAKPLGAGVSGDGGAAPSAAPRASVAPPPAGPSGSGDRPLAALGERQPQAPGPVAAAPQTSPVVKRVAYFVASKVSGSGTLRAGPGSNHAVVGTIAKGERYPIVEKSGSDEQTWYKIRLDSGVDAWVAGALGDEVEE